MFNKIKVTEIGFEARVSLPAPVQKVINEIIKLNEKAQQMNEYWGVRQIEYICDKKIQHLKIALDRQGTTWRIVQFSPEGQLESVSIGLNNFLRYPVKDLDDFLSKLETDCQAVLAKGPYSEIAYMPPGKLER